MTPALSVVVLTHNPHAGRLRRALAALRQQALPPVEWETILVDNASTPAIDPVDFAGVAPANLRLVREPQLGLTAARRRGFSEARGDLLVLVDDDNVLAPDYLAQVLGIFAGHSSLGAAGGRIVPEFEQPPAPWMREFDGLLACRDLGPARLIAPARRDPQHRRLEYPACAPVGAGLALRAHAVARWHEGDPARSLTDRQGTDLTSGGDNDIVLTLLHDGWDVGYFPELALTHLIPAARLTRPYLARLNRAISKSWMQVLAQHSANPWRPIARWTVPLRQLKAWFTYRAWSGPAAFVRWQAACGHFEGRATLTAR